MGLTLLASNNYNFRITTSAISLSPHAPVLLETKCFNVLSTPG